MTKIALFLPICFYSAMLLGSDKVTIKIQQPHLDESIALEQMSYLDKHSIVATLTAAINANEDMQAVAEELASVTHTDSEPNEKDAVKIDYMLNSYLTHFKLFRKHHPAANGSQPFSSRDYGELTIDVELLEASSGRPITRFTLSTAFAGGKTEQKDQSGIPEREHSQTLLDKASAKIARQIATTLQK